MPTRQSTSSPLVDDSSIIPPTDTVSSEVHASTDISTPATMSSAADPASEDTAIEDRAGPVVHEDKHINEPCGIPAKSKSSNKALRAKRTEPAKPCLDTSVVIKKSTELPCDAGADSLSPFHMTRGELTAKRGGFFYHISPINRDQWGFTYKPSGKYELTETYVWYDISRTGVAGSAREFYDWIFRKIEFHSGGLPRAMIAKHHRKWIDDYPNQPREEALELGAANVYVAMMLQEFKNAVRDCKPTKGSVLKAKDVYDELKLMKVSPVYILQGMGYLKYDESFWQVCEATRHASHSTYVHGYNFTPNESHNNRWSDLVQAFLHYINQKSGGNTIVAQLDCDIKGTISNLMCYDKEAPQHLADPGDISNAFKHFDQDHKCNDICSMLKIAKRKSSAKLATGMVQPMGK
ncbi:hypothetical protein DFH28DRAFT_162128 [Melampsora americana]|nr:hypothetical protein DFH28DRAFT_162128 [Melampsora americana]